MKRTALAFLLLLVPLALMARTRAVRTGPIDSPAAWLRHRALSHASFARMVASADVVALGDVTHATHETYAAKQAIVPRLVARGFRVLAFEAPYGEYKALDEYVLVGTGDPAAALNVPLYWFWDTNEILDLVRWARAQNAAGLTPPIRIAGIDPTSPRVTAAEVIAYLERVDPPFAAEVASIYHCIREGYTGTNRCRTKVASVRVSISLKRDAYLLASSLHEYEEVLHAARVIEQGERVLADGMPARDEPMAENVLRRSEVRRGSVRADVDTHQTAELADVLKGFLGTILFMRVASGRVIDGRVELMDTELPEGASVIVLLREGDETFEADEETERMLLESIAQCERGQTVPLEQVLEELRRRG